MAENELTAPTPTWQGIPKELNKHIVKSLTVMDRCVIRAVSQTERLFADALPYDIEKIHIVISPTELKMTIFDNNGPHYDAPTVSFLAAIFKNPFVKIGELRLESEQGPFGHWLTELCEVLRKWNVQDGSLEISKLSFVSTEYFRGFTQLSDISDNVEIGYIVKLCKPQSLKTFHVDAKFADSIWTTLIKTEQFKTSETIEISKQQNFDLHFFEKWTGKHLNIKSTPHTTSILDLVKKLQRYYMLKPLGSSFRIRSIMDGVTLYPLHGNKFQTWRDPSIALYLFSGPFFFNGYIRPSDGTPDGQFNCPEDETRHLPDEETQ
ncbi:unnamed protein product [Caenorhabditis brenneri]